MAGTDQSAGLDVAAMKRGETAAFESVVRLLTPRLLGVARRILGDSGAEDAVQEAWIVAFRRIGEFEERSRLETWLTRIVTNPLNFTMLVAIFTVHWENGWLAIADCSSWLANERVMGACERNEMAISILREHGNYSWLRARGSITILNNGIEFGVTYLVMLVSLLFTGGGRWTSLDHFIGRTLR